jgi:hypothetical protein
MPIVQHQHVLDFSTSPAATTVAGASALGACPSILLGRLHLTLTIPMKSSSLQLWSQQGNDIFVKD